MPDASATVLAALVTAPLVVVGYRAVRDEPVEWGGRDGLAAFVLAWPLVVAVSLLRAC